MRIYNTLTREKEEFVPLREGKVGIYVCGPTVYDYPHIGHARTYIAFDVLVRYLRWRGYDVTYVVNITNVDDKIIARAEELGTDPMKLADEFEKIFYEDMDALGLLRADVYPRVTEHIDDIISLVMKLVDKGYAYVSEGGVYFSVEKVKDYGKLSRQSLKDMIAGARVEVDKSKRHPMDFALWKRAKEGEERVSWDSPWGRGRPGWHIECSAMSTKYLGETFDIHGGAMDLIFPHHENEILQVESVTGKAFVRYWLHTGFLMVGGEKMSKSLGNFITVREVLEKYPPEAFRLLVLKAHYRSPIDFTYDALEKADRSYRRLVNAVERLREHLGGEKGEAPEQGDPGLGDAVEKARAEFLAAMEDDLSTPRALAALFTLARETQGIDLRVVEREAVKKALAFFDETGDILGLPLRKPKMRESLENLRERLLSIASRRGVKISAEATAEEVLEAVISRRTALRLRREYGEADRIRQELAEIGIVLEDKGDRTAWRLS
jgi:cysteinyl-tRNA synthetase